VEAMDDSSEVSTSMRSSLELISMSTSTGGSVSVTSVLVLDRAPFFLSL
jgi:hypothetical protein